MFLHSEHMTFAQKVIEGDNNSGKKTQICRNCHKRHTEFLQKSRYRIRWEYFLQALCITERSHRKREQTNFAIYPKMNRHQTITEGNLTKVRRKINIGPKRKDQFSDSSQVHFLKYSVILQKGYTYLKSRELEELPRFRVMSRQPS